MNDMKKYRLLLLSVLLLALSFAVAWYSDLLFDALFVLVFQIYFFLFICFVVLLILSVWRLIKHKETPCLASLAVLALLVALILRFPFRDARVKVEWTMLEADRLKVVEMIRNDQLQPKDNIGNIVLPLGYKRLSSSGEVFQCQNDEEGQVICFWVFRGMLSGSVELIYSSGGEELIRTNEANIGPITKMEKLKDCWYYVETG